MQPSIQKIKTVIVDDEPHARAAIRILLQRDPEIELTGEAADGFEAIQMIRSEKPQLLFLDVQMPEVNGFEVLDELSPEEFPVIVFVTAYDRFALKAFEVNALDYLLKPFDDERFDIALQRAKEQIKRNQDGDLGSRLFSLLSQYSNESKSWATSTHLKRLSIKSGGRIFFIKADEIDWIEAADQYVQLHVGSKTHLLRESMLRLEKKLDPEKFHRIHRSTIVHLERIKELQPLSSGDYSVRLQDNTKLKLSRNRRATLEKKMGGSF